MIYEAKINKGPMWPQGSIWTDNGAYMIHSHALSAVV